MAMFNFFNRKAAVQSLPKTPQENLLETMKEEREKQLAAKAAVEKQQALVEQAKAIGDRMITEKLTKRDQLLREQKLAASTWEVLDLLHQIQGR